MPIDPDSIRNVAETAADQNLIKWLWALLLIPIGGGIKLIWDNHVKAHDIELALEQQRSHLEKMMREHQEYVARKHPTTDHFNQRMEDMITPIQLNVLELNRDLKEQNHKLDTILVKLINGVGQ